MIRRRPASGALAAGALVYFSPGYGDIHTEGHESVVVSALLAWLLPWLAASCRAEGCQADLASPRPAPPRRQPRTGQRTRASGACGRVPAWRLGRRCLEHDRLARRFVNDVLAED